MRDIEMSGDYEETFYEETKKENGSSKDNL